MAEGAGDQPVDAALLLYHHFPKGTAPAVLQHIESFERCSRFPIIGVNTDDGFPRALNTLMFPVVILHYSLFAGRRYFLDRAFLRYLDRAHATPKIAFFQDEHRSCEERFAFIDRYGVDTVYTLLAPPFGEEVYRKHSAASTVHTTLTGYVTDQLVAAAAALARPDEERTIDVGYRARRLPFVTGRGGQEKYEITRRFAALAANRGLRLDIATGERHLVRGDDWYPFVARCRAMLGVEAGVSVFDLDGSAARRAERVMSRHPRATFDQVEREVLHEYEDRIPYRTISPRHFEAAAFRVVQILFEGHYSGVLQPDVHYLALAKDFSNFDDVMRRLEDPGERHAITERAYDDLIASGRHDAQVFFEQFDAELAELGLRERALDARGVRVAADTLRPPRLPRRLLARGRSLRTRPFPGRYMVSAVLDRVPGRRRGSG